MNALVRNSLWAFSLALLLSLVLMPICVVFGTRLNLMVIPRIWRRGRSKRPVTYLGGPAVCLATVAGAVLPSSLGTEYKVILAGAVAMLLIGYRDNKRRRSKQSNPLFRAISQVVIAGAVWWFAFRGTLPGPLDAVLVVTWLVAATRSLNLLDNMNGVAGSTVLATTVGLIYLAFLSGEPRLAVLMAALCGACLGFLPHNWRRAKVYLGSGGPEFIGFLLGAAALRISSQFGGVQRWAVAAALLAVPLVDGFTTLFSRLVLGKSLREGNVDHISHKLARLGLRTATIATIHGFAALTATAAVEMAFRGAPRLPVVVLALYVMLAALLTVGDQRGASIKSGERRVFRSVSLAMLSILGLGLLSATPALGAALDLRKAKTAFSSGIASARSFDLAGARTSFKTGTELAAAAERKLDTPLTLPARYLPIIGDNLRAVSALAKGGRMMGPAVEEALKAAEVFPVGPNGPEIGFTEGRINIEPWRQAVESLGRASSAARLAVAGPIGADGMLLPPVASARTAFIEQGSAGAKTLASAGDAAALILHLFGAEKPRTFFLAIQNSVELRATGGFLGAFGILTADSGKLTLERFEANTALPGRLVGGLPSIGAPAQASQEFADNYDRFSSRSFWANTNMTPDFPTVAEVLANMWEQSTKRKIDGVIAIDAVGLNELLKLVGPVNAPQVGQINSENFLPLALNEAYVRFPEKENRSSFLLEVGREVWSRLLAGNFSSPRALLGPMSDMVGTKRLQMWSRDEQKRIARLGAAGALHPSNGNDYLMVVGQNAGGNKIDYYARRRVSYGVDLSNPADPRGRVSVQIQNQAPSSGLPPYIIGPVNPVDPPGLNRTFTSIYLPGSTGIVGAVVDGIASGVETKTEKGLLATSKFLDVLSGKTGTLTVQTRGVPAAPGVYRLRVQHQPSLNPDSLEIDIKLPEGTSVIEVTPGMKVDGNRVLWSGVLDSQKDFLVRYAE